MAPSFLINVHGSEQHNLGAKVIKPFSSQLTKTTDKLECYITLGWKGLSWTNTLSYWSIMDIVPRNILVNLFFVTYEGDR